MPELTLSPDFIAIIAGAVLSLFFSYFPNVNTTYAALDDGKKKLIMLGILVLVAIAIFAMGCFQVVVIPGFTCDKATAVQFGWILFYAILANQGTFKLTPQTGAVVAAKTAPVAAPPIVTTSKMAQ